MGYTDIEWTDETDNIIVVAPGGGRRLVVPEGLAGVRPYTGNAPSLVLKSKLIASWARQRKPRRHFVSSMTDVAGPWVPAAWVYEYLDGMTAAPRQTFQVLTKHPGVLLEHVTAWLRMRGRTALPHNIQVGVTAGNQARADELISILLRIPAKVRFLSIEPLLGLIDLSRWLPDAVCECGHAETVHYYSAGDDQARTVGCEGGDGTIFNPICGCRKLRGEKKHALGDAYWNHGLHWVIVGGESGKRARPTYVRAVLSVVEQCRAAGVPVFVKQLGKILRTPYYDVDVFRDGGEFRERALDRRHRVIESTGHVWPPCGGYQPDLGSVIEFRPRHHKGADMTEWPAVLRVRELPEVA